MVFNRNRSGLFGGQVASSGGTDANDLGIFETEAALRTTHPTAIMGNFAFVNDTSTFWNWATDWVDSGISRGITSVGATQGAVPVFISADRIGNSMAMQTTVDGTSTLTVSGDIRANSLRVDRGTIEIGDVIAISDGASGATFSNSITGTTEYPVTIAYGRTGTAVLAAVPSIAPEESGVFQPDFSTQITIPSATPLVLSFTQQQDAIGWAQRVRGVSGQMRWHIDTIGADGSTVRISDGNENLPNAANFDDPSLPSNGEVAIEYVTPIDLRLNQVLAITFYSADGNDVVVLGNVAQTSPYFQSTFSSRTTESFAPLDDTATDTNHSLSASQIGTRIDNATTHTVEDIVTITGSITITAANLDTYNRHLIVVDSFSNIDINVEDGVALDFFEVFVDSNIAILVTAVSGGAARFNGESDLRFTQFEGGRFVQIATDVYGLVYDNTDVNMLDNYVDTVSATKSGNIVTLTLGRNGTLSDLTTTFNVGDDVTPPAATADIIYYGLSTSNNPAAVATASLTTETDPTNPDTISTGLTTAGQYFILLVPSAHDVVSIFDTVLNQDVTTLFTRTASVRTLNGEIYNSYVIGALNAGVNEEYVINF